MIKAPIALITGGRGFIGRAAVLAFRQARFETYTVGIPHPGDDPDFHLPVEMGTGEKLVRHLARFQPSVVVNLAAAPPNVDEKTQRQITVRFAERLLAAVERESPSTRLIQLGSATEYGETLFCGRPLVETDMCQPFTAYGCTKYETSLRMNESHRRGFQATVARLFTAVGPGMPLHSVLGRVTDELRRMKRDETILKIGNLETFRDYLDVRDVARFLVQLAVQEKRLPPVIHLCSGKAQKTGDWVEALIAASGRKLSLVKDPAYVRARDPEWVTGSTELMKDFGLDPSPPDRDRLPFEIIGR